MHIFPGAEGAPPYRGARLTYVRPCSPMGEILAHVPMSALGPPDSAQQKAQASLGAWAWKREGQDEAQREEFLLLFVWSAFKNGLERGVVNSWLVHGGYFAQRHSYQCFASSKGQVFCFKQRSSCACAGSGHARRRERHIESVRKQWLRICCTPQHQNPSSPLGRCIHTNRSSLLVADV